MMTILGLIMFYVWIHTIVICFKKLENLTNYEKGVSIAALVAFTLVLIGIIAQ